MKNQIEIVERSDPFPEGLEMRCQESTCKRDAHEFIKVRMLGQVWGMWSCTTDADGLELEIARAKAAA